MSRVGLFGGTFDPIHDGHLRLAQTAQQTLHLDTVILMPNYFSPFKADRRTASAQERLEMCRLAAQTLDFCTVSDYEIRKARVSYTVETLRWYRNFHPQEELFLLIGSDAFAGFHKWHEFRTILRGAVLAVMLRSPDAQTQTQTLEQAEQLKPYGEIVLCPGEAVPVSSTLIREAAAQGKPLPHVPETVADYIHAHGLYRTQNETA